MLFFILDFPCERRNAIIQSVDWNLFVYRPGVGKDNISKCISGLEWECLVIKGDGEIESYLIMIIFSLTTNRPHIFIMYNARFS